jgi:hypothetical protein
MSKERMELMKVTNELLKEVLRNYPTESAGQIIQNCNSVSKDINKAI